MVFLPLVLTLLLGSSAHMACAQLLDERLYGYGKADVEQTWCGWRRDLVSMVLTYLHVCRLQACSPKHVRTTLVCRQDGHICLIAWHDMQRCTL